MLEAFFGSLDETTPDLIRTMPVDQAHVLMEQLTYYVNASLTALINRSQRHKRQLPVAEGYEFLERDELDTHEALFLRTPQDPEMASVANLKHLLLYCERVVAWNPTAIHQYDLLPPEQWIPRLADGVAQLVPIADLVRDGRIVLAQTRFLALSENVPQLIAHPDVCLSDPYAAYLLAQAARRSPELRDLIETACAGHYEIHDSKGIYRATPAVTDALLKRYPHRMNALALRRLIVYARDLREFRLDPITADPILKHHLEQGTSFNDSGVGRGQLPVVLRRFSVVVSGSHVRSGWRTARCARGHRLRLRRGGLLSGVAGTGVAGQAGAGRAHSRCQQARKASFQGQVRLIFSTRARAWRTRRAGRLSSR